MYHRWAAFALVLALSCLAPGSVAGQSAPPDHPQAPARKPGTLGRNYPNPFDRETRIPFSLACGEGVAREHVVSVRIYNVLAQLVATPVLEGRGAPLDRLRLPCGDYVGYWNGMVRRSGRPATPGIYIYELVVDGERSAKKMLVGR